MPEDTEGNGAGSATTMSSIIDAAFAEQGLGGGNQSDATGDDEDDEGDGAGADESSQDDDAEDGQSGDGESGGTDDQDLGAYADIELDTKPFEAISDPKLREQAVTAAKRRWSEQLKGLAQKDATRQEEYDRALGEDRIKVDIHNALTDPDRVEKMLPLLWDELQKAYEPLGIDLAAILGDRVKVKEQKALEDMSPEEVEAHFEAKARRKLAQEQAAKRQEEAEKQGRAAGQAKDTEAWLKAETTRLIPIFKKTYDGFELTLADVQEAFKEYPPADRAKGMGNAVKAYLADKLLEHRQKAAGDGKAGEASQMGSGGGRQPNKAADLSKITKVNLDFLDET